MFKFLKRRSNTKKREKAFNQMSLHHKAHRAYLAAANMEELLNGETKAWEYLKLSSAVHRQKENAMRKKLSKLEGVSD